MEAVGNEVTPLVMVKGKSKRPFLLTLLGRGRSGQGMLTSVRAGWRTYMELSGSLFLNRKNYPMNLPMGG